jgi:hypothetical protein
MGIGLVNIVVKRVVLQGTIIVMVLGVMGVKLMGLVALRFVILLTAVREMGAVEVAALQV